MKIGNALYRFVKQAQVIAVQVSMIGLLDA